MKRKKPGFTKVQRKWSTRLCACVVCILSFVPFFQDFYLLFNWDGTACQEYCGDYVFSSKRYVRNTNYLFQLENGDTIQMPAEYLNNEKEILLAQNAGTPIDLVFRYTTFKVISSRGSYRVISVISTDDDTIFVDESSMRNVTILALGLDLILIALCVIPSGIVLYVDHLPYKNAKRSKRLAINPKKIKGEIPKK